MVEDGFFETLEGDVWLEAELLVEQASAGSVDVERLRLPAGLVERNHQVAAQALAERMRTDECFELRDKVVVVAERELEIDAALDAREAELFEALGLMLCEVVVCEVGKRRSAPESERLAQLRRGGSKLERPRFGQKFLEAARVEVIRCELQPITGADRLDRFVAELLA